MASAIADEARDIEQSTAPKPKQRRALRSVPMPKSPNAPKSANTPKPTQAAPTRQVSQQDFEPIQAVKPIAPK